MLKIDWSRCVFRPVQQDVYDCECEGVSPPTSKTGGSTIHLCEDTSYVFLRARILPVSLLVAQVQEAKELAKGSKEGKWPVTLGGRVCEIWAKGASRWFPYVIELNGTRILWSGKTAVDEGKWNFEIQFGSALLWRCGGIGGAFEAIKQWFGAAGICIEGNLLSLNDVACDVVGVDIEQFAARVLSGRCVRRAREVHPFVKGGGVVSAAALAAAAGEGDDVDSFRCVLKGLRLESFTVGGKTAPLKVAFYDKVAELKKDKVKQALFREIWGDGVEVVTRCEFKMRREFLADCGVKTVEDYLVHRRQILAYLSRHWFRLTEDPVEKNHTIRARMWSTWAALVKAIETKFGVPRTQVVRLHPVRCDARQLEQQVIGCLATVVAWKRGRDLTAAEALDTLSCEMVRIFGNVEGLDFRERVAKAVAKVQKTLGG